MEPKLYRIKQGTYFRGFISTISGFFALILLVTLIIILVKSEYYTLNTLIAIAIISPLLFIFINFFLGFEGIEFDLDNRQFRRYVRRLGVRIGYWQDLTDDMLICLSVQYNRSNARSPTGRSAARHKSYEINLASRKMPKAILLMECKDYTSAKAKLAILGNIVGLKTKDFRKEQLDNPKPIKR